MSPCVLSTARLDLVPATLERLRAELRGGAPLAAALGARVPPEWPPERYDGAGVGSWLAALERGEEPGCWGAYYLVLRGEERARVAIGLGGFRGAPRDGTAEIGCSVLAPWQGRGLASEALDGLLALAFASRCVARVAAEARPERPASIALLRSNGFAPAGAGAEAGTLRFVRERRA